MLDFRPLDAIIFQQPVFSVDEAMVRLLRAHFGNPWGPSQAPGLVVQLPTSGGPIPGKRLDGLRLEMGCPARIWATD